MARGRNKRLIILRGLPGSGKTRRAREILADYKYSGEIFSADDARKDEHGVWVPYTDNPLLGYAHWLTQQRVFNAMKNHVHPIIVDNTNLSWGEMWPYVLMGFRRRYYIEFVVLPNNIDLWTRYERCGGQIERRKLERMERRYDPDISFGHYYPRLLRSFGGD